MLKSYEAILEHNQSIRWLSPAPPKHAAKVRIVIVMEEAPPLPLVSESPLSHREVLRRTRGAWGRGKTIEEVDAEIRQMRSEWEREWN